MEFYSTFTETGVTQRMKTNHMAELKQKIPTFSNPANQISYFSNPANQMSTTKQFKSPLVCCDAYVIYVASSNHLKFHMLLGLIIICCTFYGVFGWFKKYMGRKAMQTGPH